MNSSTPTDDLIAQGTQERGTAETAVEVSEARTTAPDPDLDPVALEARMVEVVREGTQNGPDNKTPEQIVRALLLLQGSKGRKLVFTRFDIMQIFAIWTRKLEGRERV